MALEVPMPPDVVTLRVPGSAVAHDSRDLGGRINRKTLGCGSTKTHRRSSGEIGTR